MFITLNLLISLTVLYDNYISCDIAVTSASGQCLPQTPIPLSGPEGFISSHIDSSPCLWRIQAEPGQQISVYLINFNVNHGHHETRKLGYVKHDIL